MQFRSEMLIALGSNQQSLAGQAISTLKSAASKISLAGATIRAKSEFYTSPAFPAGSGPDYINAAIALRWDIDPEAALKVLHSIEMGLGRTREARWASRTLDLDLIACGDLVAPDLRTHTHWRTLPLHRQMTDTPDRLILPHPRLQDRAFVLVPLADVAPDWRHPILDRTVTEMRDALDPADIAAVRLACARA